MNQSRFQSWLAFHRDNPQVYALFVRFAQEARDRGTKCGARMIGERIRWFTSVETNATDYRLNDHYWPYYARLLMGTDESFAGFFETRDRSFDATVDEIVDAVSVPQGMLF